MHNYRVHTVESAPPSSRQALEVLRQTLGLIPNLAATMAESPVLVNGFVAAQRNFHGGSFTAAERQILLLANAVANRCAWAVAFHSTVAAKEGVEPEAIAAIRERRRPAGVRPGALWALTSSLIERRGSLEEADLAAFARAGFGPDQVLEVIAGLAVSVMANYAGNIARPPLEEPFKAETWVA
jgi:AhpD family alkylhydroperoxidase